MTAAIQNGWVSLEQASHPTKQAKLMAGLEPSTTAEDSSVHTNGYAAADSTAIAPHWPAQGIERLSVGLARSPSDPALSTLEPEDRELSITGRTKSDTSAVDAADLARASSLGFAFLPDAAEAEKPKAKSKWKLSGWTGKKKDVTEEKPPKPAVKKKDVSDAGEVEGTSKSGDGKLAYSKTNDSFTARWFGRKPAEKPQPPAAAALGNTSPRPTEAGSPAEPAAIATPPRPSPASPAPAEPIGSPPVGPGCLTMFGVGAVAPVPAKSKPRTDEPKRLSESGAEHEPSARSSASSASLLGDSDPDNSFRLRAAAGLEYRTTSPAEEAGIMPQTTEGVAPSPFDAGADERDGALSDGADVTLIRHASTGVPDSRKGVSMDGEGSNLTKAVKEHRRHRSLSSLLPLKLGKRGRTKSQNVDDVLESLASGDLGSPTAATTKDSARAAELPRPKTPKSGDALKVADKPPSGKTPDGPRSLGAALACFGGGKLPLGDEEGSDEEARTRGPVLPAGIVGMKNLGNTCFVNAAVQCLRYTPELALALVPDLLTASQSEPGTPDSKASAAGSTLLGGSAASTPAKDLSGSSADQQRQASAASPMVTPLSTPQRSGAATPVRPPAGGSPPGYPPAAAEIGEALDTLASQQPSVEVLRHMEQEAHLHDVETLPAVPEVEASAGGVLASGLPEQAQLPPAIDATEPPTQLLLGTAASAVGGNVAEVAPASLAQPLPPIDEGAPAAVDPAGLSLPPSEPSASPASAPMVPSEAAAATVGAAKAAAAVAQEAAAEQRQVSAAEGGSAAQAVLPEGHAVAADGTAEAGPLEAGASSSTAVAAPAPATAPRIPLEKGEMADAFRRLVRQLYTRHNGSSVDPSFLLRKLSSLSVSENFCDGGQHDCEEVLSAIMDRLHEDLNEKAVVEEEGAADEPKKAAAEEKEDPNEPEVDKADRLWDRHLATDDSVITNLFGGQLQRSITCHKCKSRFTKYEFFKGLSLPLVKEGKPGSVTSWFSTKTTPTSIHDCMQSFTDDEVLQGDDDAYYCCEKCKERTAATIRLRIHRFPRVLMLHIKRFKYAGMTKEKLTANVSFPLKGLKLAGFASDESGVEDAEATYELYAVINHYGNMVGGHYTAACRVGLAGGKEQWYSFNDEIISKIPATSVVAACAYILFYVRKD